MGPQEGERLIRVDMTRQAVSIEPFPVEWRLLGGRALSARILRTECNPTCDPLGPENVLVIAPGVLSGTAAPTSGRISIGGKSPLTGGIKEASSGGNPGQDLAKLGYRAILVKGQPEDSERLYGLEVTATGARVVPADDYKGLWNYANCQKLLAHYPKTASAISIGPAGEMKLRGASVATTDRTAHRRPARHAARGGLGAVMGSKGLKWVLVDPGQTPVRKPAAAAAFASLSKSYTKEYLAGPQMFKFGTASVVPLANKLNTFPYKNRTEGQSPDAENLAGARILESFAQRGGAMHNCMTGCVVKCSNIVHNAQGEYTTSGLEFETVTLLGSNCAMQSWEDVADLDRLCDELGLDTIETGAAVAVLMDSGGLEWGDAEGAKQLLRQIAQGTEMGRAVGNGALAVADKTGHKRVPVVKGQAIPAWDPRPLKATGVTYASSPMGADHTAGLILKPRMSPEEYARASQELQLVNAVVDGSGFCMFLGPNLDDIRAFYTHLYGEEVTRQEIADLGWDCLQDEWAFNDAAGFTSEDDVLPECMLTEGVGPEHALKFDVGADCISAVRVRFPIRDELFSLSASG